MMRGPALLVTRTLLRVHHWLLWAAVIIAAVATLIGLGLGAWSDSQPSVWEYAANPLRWMLFVTGVLTTPMIMPAYVAHGITRRTFATAAGLAGAVLVGACALYLTGGLLVERAVVTATTAAAPTLANPHLYDSTGQAHLMLTEYLLIFAAYLVSGWLVGTAYRRFQGWWGTLCLPATVLPLVAVETLLSTAGWAPIDALRQDLGPSQAPVAVALSILALAAGVVAVRALVHAVPINPRSS